MRFNQYTWNLYKQSSEGQKAIKEFEEAVDNYSEFEIFEKYNPYSAQFFTKEYFLNTCNLFWFCSFDGMEAPKTDKEAKKIYTTLVTKGIYEDENVAVINEGEYQLMLSANDMLSFMLYYFAPEYFFPNLFRNRFFNLNKIVDTFEIEMPSIPKKSDYKARCMYYWQLCEVFYNFRINNQLSPSELCAFLYDFAPKFITNDKTEVPQPAQAWFIGGKTDPKEAILNQTFWQANSETKKGDILVHVSTQLLLCFSRK